MSRYRIFEIQVSARIETTRRDVDGWVTGYAPGNGKFSEPATTLHRVVAEREPVARARALDIYRGSGVKDVEIVDVVSHEIDALIVEIG